MDRVIGGRPLDLLVLGPEEEEPLFLILRLGLGLKEDKSTTRVGAEEGSGGLMEVAREGASGEIALVTWLGD